MKKIKLILLLSLIAFTVISCREPSDVPNPDNENVSIKDIVVPQGFNWETTSDVEVSITISGTKAYEAKSKISIFTSNPSEEGELILSGTAAPGKALSGAIRVPSAMTEVFLKMESPYGQVKTAIVPIQNNLISYSFNEKSKGEFKSLTDPECNEEGDIIITQTSGEIKIEGGFKKRRNIDG